jgi:hypothetical protein
MQSPLADRCASLVISIVDGWVERIAGWPVAWNLKLKIVSALITQPNILQPALVRG